MIIIQNTIDRHEIGTTAIFYSFKREMKQQISTSVKSQPAPLAYKPRTTTITTPPRSSSSPNVRPTPKKSWLLRGQRFPFYMICFSTAGLSLYGVSVYLSLQRNAARSAELRDTIPADNWKRFNETASTYDSGVDLAEKVIGLTWLRKKLCSKASGHVLEAAVGTGRNGDYYPLAAGKVKSLTMVDRSTAMIQQARAKWTKHNVWFMNVVFRVQDAAEPVPGPRSINSKTFANEPDGFDTVVQTMGLCSTGDPEALLRNLGAMTRPGGKILLLEHGKSHYSWLNSILDSTAPAHAEQHGCWWNKDIGAIVERSGLEVVHASRHHLGTTWWFELRPRVADNNNHNQETAAAAAATTTAKDQWTQQQDPERIVLEAKTRPGLKSWWSWGS